MRNLKSCVFSLVLIVVMAMGLAVSSLAYETPDFSDLPADHWAHDPVMRMADQGFIQGTGGGMFSPETRVSVAQFLTLVCRIAFPEIAADATDTWYGPYVDAALTNGLLAGTQVNVSSPEAEITRYDMAVVLSATVKKLGQAEALAQPGQVTDYGTVPTMYAQAVLSVYGTGLITGDQNGNFNGFDTMTRGELATVIDRLVTLKSGGIQSSPAEGSANAPIIAQVATIETGKLHLSINAAFPPYAMVDSAGNYTGIDVEVANAIADKLGLELVVDDMAFDASLLAVQLDLSDIVMGGLYATYERQTVMDFSKPYARNAQVVIVREGSPITTLDDLASVKWIGTQQGTTAYIYCSAPWEAGGYGENHVLDYNSAGTTIRALLNGQVDCVVMDRERAETFAAALPGLTILDNLYADETYAVAVNKGNTQMLYAVNQAIAQLQENGTLPAILDKYNQTSIAVAESKVLAAERSYLAAGEVTPERLVRCSELLNALADNGLLNKLDSMDLSDDAHAVFGYDGRFTVHLPLNTVEGMHYWLRRFRAAMAEPAVVIGQRYTVEFPDGKTIRFVPN